MAKKKQYGLVGKNISYSFSKAYFAEKFEKENNKNHSYENFDIQEIFEFPGILKNNPDLKGINVTIPYKEVVIPFLDKMSKNALKIGAVNTIKFTGNGKTKGYNTDFYGFKKSLKPLLKSHHKNALILGTGGASKAVAYALRLLEIDYILVSREPSEHTLSYDEIDASTFEEYQIIINCTPLGTSPNVEVCPDIPYDHFTEKHIAYDLIYNPEETLFLKKAKEKGAVIKNGYEMLVFQAEKAWKIWKK
ncbi:shikimate dehydrogenase family protein [Flavobacterium sp. PLA-1-15]|uniref:shikimate dehydrogenase family protein n=1 Tax=Flavobacterium sp. PLA-1-15 TaxID=3380533 RepID=UPI003B7A2F2C